MSKCPNEMKQKHYMLLALGNPKGGRGTKITKRIKPKVKYKKLMQKLKKKKKFESNLRFAADQKSGFKTKQGERKNVILEKKEFKNGTKTIL